MDDLDRALARLADAPAPRALEDIEARILARIGTRRAPRRAGLGLGAVTLAALAMGVIGAGLPAAANPAPPLALLGEASPLAPSSLLIGAP